jgi:uncharacterized protein YdiU (UPF0061 family)
MPLIEDQDLAMRALEDYKSTYADAWLSKFLSKLGLPFSADSSLRASDLGLLNELLDILAKEQIDFTIFWRRLSHAVSERAPEHSSWQHVSELFLDASAWKPWQIKYVQRLANMDPFLSQQKMLRVNPKYVLRNHLAEAAIQKSKIGDHSEVETLFKLLKSPFDEQSEFDHYANLPPAWAAHIEISCSS